METEAPWRSNKTKPSSGLPALLTVNQVIAETGFSRRTIRRRISDGTLRAVRYGPREIRIERDSLTQLVQPLGVA